MRLRVLRLALLLSVTVAGGVVLSSTQASATGGEPAISGVSATNINEHGATLEAQIDPQGIATTYEFWVESAVCTGGSATCERSGHPYKEEEGFIAAGSGSKMVTDDVTDLLTDTYFWYWVVAENLGGTAESSHGLFETGTASSGSCSEGCHVEVPPYESKLSPGIEESGRSYGEGALAREAERQAKAAKEQAEREAAAARADRPVTATTSSPPVTSTGGLSLDGAGRPERHRVRPTQSGSRSLQCEPDNPRTGARGGEHAEGERTTGAAGNRRQKEAMSQQHAMSRFVQEFKLKWTAHTPIANRATRPRTAGTCRRAYRA
jgi:hypothetical protein